MTALDFLRSLAPTGGKALAPVPWLQRSTLAEPEDWLREALTGRSIAGPRVTPEGALALDAVFACVNLIAGQAGSLPLVVYRGRERRSRERFTADPRYGMLHDSPNPVTASDAFIEALLACILLWGNGYAEKVRDRSGRVAELWIAAPKSIGVELTDQGAKRFTVAGETGGTFGSDRFLHLPGFTLNGWKGLSVVELARESLGTVKARDEYEQRLYANDATPGGILSVEGELSPEAAARFRDQWEAAHRGAGNRHRVAVLEGGTKWQSIGMPLKDQEWIERSRFTVGQVARWFQVAPELIGGDRSGSLTYSTVEGQAIQFLTFTLRRWLVRMERGMRADVDLFPERDVYPEFLMDALMRADSNGRATFYRTMVELGAFSVNDILELENRPGIGPGGDVRRPLWEAPAPAPAPVDGGGGGDTRSERERQLEEAGLLGLAAQRLALGVRGGVLSAEESRVPLGLEGPPPAPAEPVADPAAEPADDQPEPDPDAAAAARALERLRSTAGRAGATTNGNGEGV